MKIANFEIEKKTFIIAEIGSNHNGNFDTAKELISLARESGADAVKFQTYNAQKYIDESVLPMAHVRGQYKSQQERFKSLEFTPKQWEVLIEHAQKEGLIFFSTPADLESADFLDKYVPAFKIQSGDVTDISLIRHVVKKDKPIIMSTGMAEESEIEAALREIPKDRLILLHCVSIYPTPPEKVALQSISYLRKKFDVPVGYSDHTMSSLACLSAVALGAVVIERHFTNDKNQPLGDHKFSAAPFEFKEMVENIREIEAMRGDFNSKLTKPELNMRYAMRRGLSLAKDVPAGTVLTEGHLLPLRPEKGISASRVDFVIGKRIIKDLREGHFIEEADLAQ